jgi:hypothetical protein
LCGSFFSFVVAGVARCASLAVLGPFNRFHSAAHPALECSINVMLRIREARMNADDRLRACITEPVLQQRLAKYMVLQCFRNSMLEDLHAGVSPSSAAGDYSDVTVSSPYGVIPWPKVSRLNDDEMKQLMIDVVNRAYRFIHMLFDEETGSELLLLLAQDDPLPRWNEPTLGT